MPSPAAERYLRLGLQLGRHVDGLVDGYFGPPELAEAVHAAPPPDPAALVGAADDLLADLADGWLRDQVVGVRTFATVLAGEQMSYADEVEGCYGVRPAYTDEAVFAAAHERLDDLLPGHGRVAVRYRRWQEAQRVPAAQVQQLVAAVVERARSWTRELVELPAEEGIELVAVHDVPWLAFTDYLGGLRSEVSVNVELPRTALELLHLTVHETYPGHHVERTMKEHVLVRGRGLLEETVVLVPTPQSLLTEGIAELAVAMVLDSDGGDALAAVLHDAGIPLDLGPARAVERAMEPCRWAEVNAALMRHEHGAGEAEVVSYLQRWGLAEPELAAHLVRFLDEPSSRSYVVTYPAGRELCAAYVGDDPARFVRLLTEQVRVRDLVAAARDTSG